MLLLRERFTHWARAVSTANSCANQAKACNTSKCAQHRTSCRSFCLGQVSATPTLFSNKHYHRNNHQHRSARENHVVAISRYTVEDFTSRVIAVAEQASLCWTRGIQVMSHEYVSRGFGILVEEVLGFAQFFPTVRASAPPLPPPKYSPPSPCAARARDARHFRSP